MQYSLDVTENDKTTSILVRRDRTSLQVTCCQKDYFAMVYVWEEVDKKMGEFRCNDMQEARKKVWEIACDIGRTGALRL